jgi:membrane-bound lytic murein transglycosylase B
MASTMHRRHLLFLLGAGLTAGAVAPALAQGERRPPPRRPARPPAKRRPAPAAAAAAAANTGAAWGSHPAVREFAADVAERRGLPLAWLERHLGQARRIEAARRLVMPGPPGSAKNWAAYRARFIEPQRIAAGVQFWRTHERWLAEAEARFGVPAAIVVGIVGVETFYGRIVGNFRVADVLATLAFDFPPGRSDRSRFFRTELEEFFVLAAREGVDPLAIKGSYAGAMGLPQFMPSSVNRWAVDFDADGHVDLHGSAPDAIGSVARYIAEHGWRRGMPTHYAVHAVPGDAEQRRVLLAPDIVPSFSALQMTERGAVLEPAALAHEGPLALVELENGGGDAPSTFVAGTQNFYVVTRYNWSSYYALAVIELGDAVKAAL